MAVPISRSLRSVLRRSYGTVQSSTSATGITPSWTAQIPSPLRDAISAQAPRTNWTREEIQQIYETPLNQLTHAAVWRREGSYDRFG